MNTMYSIAVLLGVAALMNNLLFMYEQQLDDTLALMQQRARRLHEQCHFSTSILSRALRRLFRLAPPALDLEPRGQDQLEALLQLLPFTQGARAVIQKRRAIKHVELVLSELEQCSASEGFVPGDLAITLFNALLTAFFNVELVRLCVIKTIKLFGFLGIRSQTMGSLEGFAADYERSTFILRNVLAPVKFAQELRKKLTERSFNFVAVLAAVFTALRFREKRRRVVGLTRASHSQSQEKQNQN